MDTAIRLPQAELNIYNKANPVTVPIIENRIATATSSPNIVRHITFDVTGTELENRVKAGQSLGVLPPGTDEKGKPHALRLYSIASPSSGEDGHGRHYSTTVKRLIEELPDDNRLYLGVCSNYLAGLKPGDTVRLTGPSGKRFLLPEEPEKFNYIFFATGTGVAPFRGMLMELAQLNVQPNVILAFGCPYRSDVLYEDFFEGVREKMPSFQFLKTFSREQPRPDGSRPYVQHQISDNPEFFLPILEQPNTLIYICGIKGMEFGIYQELMKSNLAQYLQFRHGADPQKEEIGMDELRKSIKPGDRVFVETY